MPPQDRCGQRDNTGTSNSTGESRHPPPFPGGERARRGGRSGGTQAEPRPTGLPTRGVRGHFERDGDFLEFGLRPGHLISSSRKRTPQTGIYRRQSMRQDPARRQEKNQAVQAGLFDRYPGGRSPGVSDSWRLHNTALRGIGSVCPALHTFRGWGSSGDRLIGNAIERAVRYLTRRSWRINGSPGG